MKRQSVGHGTLRCKTGHDDDDDDDDDDDELD